MSFRDSSLLDRDSLGCLYRYMTARPMPLCFSVSWLTLGSCRKKQSQLMHGGPAGSIRTHLHQDPQQLLPDPEGRQRLVWKWADPLFDGRHHAAVDERLLQVLPEGEEGAAHGQKAEAELKGQKSRILLTLTLASMLWRKSVLC